MTTEFSFNVGTEDFTEIITTQGYYVDKTSYLQELFLGKNNDKNPLFLRPRRFGKTMNFSMIKAFCELNYLCPGDKSTQQRLFVDNGRALAVAGAAYQLLRERVMGEYPVLSVSFKTVEGWVFAEAVSQILLKIAEVYDKFSFLTHSHKQDPADIRDFAENSAFCKTQYKRLQNEDKLNEAVIIASTFLSKIAFMLHKEFDRQVIVMIDEYDVPLQKATVAAEPYYDRMLDLIKKLSGNTFKQNPDPWLYKGLVTGCLKVAHQSVFTDANNFRVYDMDLEPYTGFFGFTAEETQKLLSDYALEDKAKSVRAWYDGYRFGRQKIFCPWSLMNYCNDLSRNPECEPSSYWINSSGNDLITLYTQNIVESHSQGNVSRLQQLLNREPVTITLKEFATYPDLRRRVDFDSFMTMMLHTGYVTFAAESPLQDRVTIRIPNLEVLKCFESKFDLIYSENNPHWLKAAVTLTELLLNNDADEAKEQINSLLGSFLSIRNSGSELYYHGFMLGVLALGAGDMGVELAEERESGEGFTDLILKDPSCNRAVILEFKKGFNTPAGRAAAARDAITQITQKDYAAVLRKEGYAIIYGLGLGFGGKSCEILSLGNLADDTNRSHL